MVVGGWVVRPMFAQEFVGTGVVHTVLDLRLSKFVQQTTMQLCNNTGATRKKVQSFRFPGPLPITVEREHVMKIRASKMMFTPKADGTRALLCFVRYFLENDWRNMVVLVHRDGKCQLVELSVSPDLFQNGGSVYDGELVLHNDGPGYAYAVFDCYAFQGVCYSVHTIDRRLSKVRLLLKQLHTPRTVDSFVLLEKPYSSFSTTNLDDARAFLANTHYLEYATDGIILVTQGPVTFGTDYNQYKLKMHHTIDLIVIVDEGTIYLASLDEADDTYVTKQRLDAFPEGVIANTVVECTVVIESGVPVFTPFMVRPDKTNPNTERVIERTLNTITDDVRLEELVR